MTVVKTTITHTIVMSQMRMKMISDKKRIRMITTESLMTNWIMNLLNIRFITEIVTNPDQGISSLLHGAFQALLHHPLRRLLHHLLLERQQVALLQTQRREHALLAMANLHCRVAYACAPSTTKFIRQRSEVLLKSTLTASWTLFPVFHKTAINSRAHKS